MVLSLKQKTINQQFDNLVDVGIIKSTFGLQQIVGPDGKYTFELIDELPKTPQNSCFLGEIRPSVLIESTGQTIIFKLEFTSGTAWFWQGMGPAAQLQEYDMTGWVFSANVNLDLKELELKNNGAHQLLMPGNQPNQQLKIDVKALDQLNHFKEENYSINCLFTNFEDTTLWKFNPSLSSAGSSGDVGLEQFKNFMDFYVRNLQTINNGNPYVLGYFPEAKKVKPNNDIPEILQASGVTYSCFKAAQENDSTLNYLLVTKGGKKTVPPGKFDFDTNWITKPNVHAKMIYSPSNIMTNLILEPFYNQFATKVHTEVAKIIGNAPVGNPYAQAVTPLENGFSYLISNWGHDHQVYQNTYTVAFDEKEDGLYLRFAGLLKMVVYEDVDFLFLEGSVTDTITATWSKNIKLYVDKNDKGQDVLAVDTDEAAFINKADDRDFDGPAGKLTEFFEKILDAIDGFLDFLNLDFLTFLTDIFHNIFEVKLNHLSLDSIGNSMGSSTEASIVLPAGDTFFIKSPGCYPYGAITTDLFYKSES